MSEHKNTKLFLADIIASLYRIKFKNIIQEGIDIDNGCITPYITSCDIEETISRLSYADVVSKTYSLLYSSDMDKLDNQKRVLRQNISDNDFSNFCTYLVELQSNTFNKDRLYSLRNRFTAHSNADGNSTTNKFSNDDLDIYMKDIFSTPHINKALIYFEKIYDHLDNDDSDRNYIQAKKSIFRFYRSFIRGLKFLNAEEKDDIINKIKPE